MNKAQIIEALKLTGAGAAIIVGFFLLAFMLPLFMLFLFFAAIFLAMSFVFGVMLKDLLSGGDDGKRNRKSL